MTDGLRHAPHVARPHPDARTRVTCLVCLAVDSTWDAGLAREWAARNSGTCPGEPALVPPRLAGRVPVGTRVLLHAKHSAGIPSLLGVVTANDDGRTLLRPTHRVDYTAGTSVTETGPDTPPVAVGTDELQGRGGTPWHSLDAWGLDPDL